MCVYQRDTTLFGTGEGGRTLMTFRSSRFKRGAYTNFATPALFGAGYRIRTGTKSLENSHAAVKHQSRNFILFWRPLGESNPSLRADNAL